MMDYALLKALREVVASGSFEAAARRLAISPSAVSQRVKLLEERTGAALVVRGQPARATEAGRRLCRHVDEVELLEHGLRVDLGEREADAPWPRLRVAVNADSLATWFLPALAQVPGRLFDLAVDDEDHTAEALRRGEVLAAVTAAPGPVAGCSHRALGSLVYEATASPDFVSRWFPDGVTLGALALAPSLSFGPKDRLQDRWIEARFGGASPPRPLHTLPSTQGFVDASLAGLGWGLNPAGLVAGHLRSGRLVRLAENSALAVPLTWHWSRAVAPALRGLTEAVTAAAREALASAS